MLGNNIITYRKKQGLSQQQLADRMNVVRQTISKWEKELSVPDADALVRLADALDVTVPQLLGEPVAEDAGAPEYAAVLAQLNQQLAIQNRRRSRIWKIIAWVLGIVVALHVIGIVAASFFSFDSGSMVEVIETVETVDDESDMDALSVDFGSMVEIIGTDVATEDEASLTPE